MNGSFLRKRPLSKALSSYEPLSGPLIACTENVTGKSTVIVWSKGC